MILEVLIWGATRNELPLCIHRMYQLLAPSVESQFAQYQISQSINQASICEQSIKQYSHTKSIKINQPKNEIKQSNQSINQSIMV